MKESITKENNTIAQQTVEKVIELQKNCEEFVTEQSSDFLFDLYKKNLLRVGKGSNGEIVATFYKQPLDVTKGPQERNQVYRIGGLSLSKSHESKKVMLQMLLELQKEVLENDQNIIMKTENPILSEYLKRMGLVELSFAECKEKYPEYLQLYIDNSSKSEDEYYDKKFYLRKKAFSDISKQFS